MKQQKKEITKKDLTQMSKFSAEQQGCIVKLLIEDEEFRNKAIELMDINSLNADDAIRSVAGIVKELHSKNAIFDYDTIRLYINSKFSEAIKQERALAVLDKYMQNCPMSPASIQFLKDNLYPLIEFQELRRLHGEIAEMVKKQYCDKDTVMGYFKQFDNTTTFNQCTYEVLDSSMEEVDRLLKAETYEYIETSSKLINMALGGGLRKGDVGLLLAGSGVAKTCMSTSFVCNAAYYGKKVAHFVLEDKKDDILKKYIAFVTNIGVYDQHKQSAEVKNRLGQCRDSYDRMLSNIRGVYATKNNGKIKVMSTKDIDKELERMHNDGFSPDLIIVDYYDRIKKTGNEIWREDERIINELLEIATKYNAALWCPTQGGKAAQNPNVDMSLDNMSGGTWKTYAAQTAIGVQQRTDGSGEYTLTILKNRYFPKRNGLVFKFNNGTCRFENEEEIIRQLNETNECIDEIYEDYQLMKAKQIAKNN